MSVGWFTKHKIVTGILAVVVLIIIIGSANSGSKTVSAASGQPTATSGKAATPTTTAAPATTTTVDAVATWRSSHASDFTVIGADLTSFGKAATADSSSGDYTSAAEACQTLGGDAKTYQSASPIPNATLEQKWSQILSQLSTISSDCIQGIANVDSNQIAQIVPLIDQLTPELASLESDLKNA